MVATILLFALFGTIKAMELEDDHYRHGFVDKKFENGTEWTTYCTLNGPNILKMNYTHCTVNLYQFESIRIKCPRLLHTGYDFFPGGSNEVYINKEPKLTNPNGFKTVPLDSIDKDLSAVSNYEDGYDLLLNYKGRTKEKKTMYYICGARAFDVENDPDLGYITSLIEVVLVPLDSVESRIYHIQINDNPLSSGYQMAKMVREIDYYGTYVISCGNIHVNAKNTFGMPIQSGSGGVKSVREDELRPKGLLKAVSEEGGMVQFTKGAKVTVIGSHIIKHIKTTQDDMMIFFCSEYGADFSGDYTVGMNMEQAHKKLKENFDNASLRFMVPINHQSPVCSLDLKDRPEMHAFKDRFICKNKSSTEFHLTLHCPKETHTFNMEKCINSFNSWQDYRTKKLVIGKDFNIIPIFEDFYLFLFRNLTSGFRDQIECSCEPKPEAKGAKEIQVLIRPRLSCDFTDPDTYHAGIDNNICHRVIRPGEALFVTCKNGDVIYPKKDLAYSAKTNIPFGKVEYENVKRSEFKVISRGNGKFIIGLNAKTKIFLGEKYVFGCSDGRGIRETGFPSKDGGVVVITTGNPDFPEPIENKVQTLVNKLKHNEYGYYNLKLTHGELLLECKNYLKDTDDKTAVLYPINWNETYSEQPKKDVDPRTMKVTRPNEYMGFHGITFKKLPEKAKLPNSLSISIKDDAILLSRTPTPLYFICSDQNEDTVWDEKKGRFAVFEIEFDLNYREMVGCGVYPQMFKDPEGNIMTSKNCEYNIITHKQVGFHCPLSNDNPKPPTCYDRRKKRIDGKIDIFNRPDELHEARSLWVFTKEHLKNAPEGVECVCESKGATLATIVVTSASTYLKYSALLFVISIVL